MPMFMLRCGGGGDGDGGGGMTHGDDSFKGWTEHARLAV